MELAEGRPMNTDTVRQTDVLLFRYMDKELFDSWDIKTRRLLLSVSFFDSFTVDLARVLTGDSQTEQTLAHLFQVSNFIDKNGERCV